MMKSFKRSVCLIRAAIHIAAAAVRVLLVFPFCDAGSRRMQIANWSRRALAIFGLQMLAQHGSQPTAGARLLVANHVSWLDVLAIWVETDTVFVAKSEVGRWPVIGVLAERLGVIFIDRCRRKEALTTGRLMAERLTDGSSVCIFPEGTSTNGGGLQPFHAALFQPAIETGAPVQPLSIRYFRANGTRATEAAFTGDMSLVQSMWQLACADPIVIEITYLPAVEPDGMSRRALADRAQRRIDDRLREAAVGWFSDVEGELEGAAEPAVGAFKSCPAEVM